MAFSTHWFPNLTGAAFRVTSPLSPKYNCIAWAAEDVTDWWWPDKEGIGRWPAGVPREETIEAFCLVFESRGYVLCEAHDAEPGWQKVALFALDGVPTHA